MFTVRRDKGQVERLTKSKETRGSCEKVEIPRPNSKLKYCNLVRLTDFVINSWTQNQGLWEGKYRGKEILSVVSQCWELFIPHPPFTDVRVNGGSGLQALTPFLTQLLPIPVWFILCLFQAAVCTTEYCCEEMYTIGPHTPVSMPTRRKSIKMYIHIAASGVMLTYLWRC